MTTTITTIINSERAKQDDLLTALDGDGEDGVASAARLVHVSRSHRPGGGDDVSYDNHHTYRVVFLTGPP